LAAASLALGEIPSVPERLLSVVEQFDSVGLQHFSVLSPSPGRFDVTSVTEGDTLLMDTPIVLSRFSRSIESTVDAIIQAVAEKRSVRFARGGIVDSELERTFVTVGSETPTAARVLLAEALDSSPDEKIWILEYEPADDSYYIGIQWAAAIEHTFSGESIAWAIPRQPRK
jgi:hypothetical protein